LSRIYDALKSLGREGSASARRPRQLHGDDRRGSERRFRRVPVFVYGHSAQGAPFHEETHMTCVNAGGGVATLASPVAPGQRLILVHLGTQAEQACRVVRVQRGGRPTSVALAFPEARRDFWE
jgi:hypothetical protein